MKVYVDADACPVIDEIVEVCKNNLVEVTIVCDDSHIIERENIEIVVVEKGFDSSDYKILSLINKGSIVITNDYGLSAIVLAKQCYVMNFDGKVINELIIDSMLESRAFSAKMRKSNVRLKGPTKRSKDQNDIFKTKFEQFLKKVK